MIVSQDQPQRNGWVILNDEMKNAVTLKSIESLSISHAGAAVSEPIEEGSFTSYNKTAEPISISIEAMMQGVSTELQSTLTRLVDIQRGTEKLSVSTPYYEYPNMTLESIDYEMSTANGLGFLAVKLSLKEIREVAAAYSEISVDAITTAQAASPSDVSAVDTGTVATQATTEAEAEAGNKAVENIKEKTVAVQIDNALDNLLNWGNKNNEEDTVTGNT